MFMAVLEPGDPVLVETPLYAGAMPPLKNLNAECIGTSQPLRRRRIRSLMASEVGIDEGGLSPESLEKAVKDWPEGKKRPRVV